MSKILWILCAVALGLYLLWMGLRRAGEYAGAARTRYVSLGPGPIPVPHDRRIRWKPRSSLTEALLEHWASRDLPDWKKKGKVTAPRVILGKLALKRDVAAVNAYLLAQRPWGRSGSRWALHRQGDYDFTLAGLTVVLYLFGDQPDLLFPETREHLLSVLLVEEGGEPAVTVPRTLGLVRDTENHLLMTEGSRYLKNRWMALHGNNDPEYDNVKNGLEAWLLADLKELQEAGLFEFNSMPYLGYTMTALMNLEAFGSDPVRQAAWQILDRCNWEYALGSLSLRRFAPFRRQLRQAGITALDADYHTALMVVWVSLDGETSLDLKLTGGYHHALWACLLPYRPPGEVIRWVKKKPHPYFVRIGHGEQASPEIYSGGPGCLISAGGVHRGRRSMIVARPITLMLDDGARDLKDVLHLAGPGKTFRGWNNTGVYRDFACAAGPIHVPQGWTPAAQNGLWTVYRGGDNLSIAVHSRPDLGILCLFRDGDAERVLRDVSAVNSDPDALYRAFQRPGGERLTYEVNAPKNRWVMVSAGKQALDRDYDRWPMMRDAGLSCPPAAKSTPGRD